MPSLMKGVVAPVRVILELVVAPAADPGIGVVVKEAIADVEVPLGAVDVFAIEVVAPGELPLRGEGLGGEASEGGRQDRECGMASANRTLLIWNPCASTPWRADGHY